MNYAVVMAGAVVNVIAWDGIDERVVATIEGDLIQVPPELPVSIGWTYNGTFIAPPEVPPALPTLDVLVAQRDALLALASLRIAPLQDAADLDVATAEELAALKAWKHYRVALSRLDLSTGVPAWPTPPEV